MVAFKLLAKTLGSGFVKPDKALGTVSAKAERVQKEISKVKSPMQRASIFLDRWVQSNFRSEGGNVGGWEPFAFGGRIVEGGTDASAKLLQDTGALRASFKPFFSSVEAGIFSDLHYSKDHHEGIGVPQRRLLPEKQEVISDIRKIIRGHVAKALKAK